MRSRIAVTRYAPVHEQGFVLIGKRHLVDAAVAGHAADSFVNVNVVVEVDELGQIVNALPGNRFPGAITGPDRLQHGTAEPDFLMAVHARLGRWNAGKRRILHRRMAVAAVNAELADVMLVAER